MSRLRHWIDRFVGRGSGRRWRPACRAALEVEALEQRTVPTLLVTPHFRYPNESDQGGLRQSSPPIYLIYWGTYWATAPSNGDPANPSAAEVTSALKGVVGSAYLSGLTQYGVNGQASVAGPTVIHNNNPPANFSDSDITGEVADEMYYGNVPANFFLGQATGTGIYVVVTPPNLGGNESGVSDNGTGFSFNLLRGSASMQYIWLGGLPANGVNGLKGATVLDYYVDNFGHELAENITDPSNNAITVTPNSPNPAANPTWTGGGSSQVCDCEAQLYTYRIQDGVHPNGLLVQSYWSQKDDAYLIPDGTPETFTLTPSNPTNSNQLTGNMEQYALAFNGDGRTIAVGDDKGRLQITVNGTDSVEFDAGQITSITVNSHSGNSHLLVNDVSAVTSVTSITDNDTGGGSQLTIQGPLGGTLTDTLSAANSGSLPLGGLTVSYNKIANVTLKPTGTVSNLTLKGGPFATELDTVSDAGAGSVQFDGGLSNHGTLNYSSVTELDDLVQIQSAEYDFTGSVGVFPPYVAVVDGPVVNGVQTTSLQQQIVYVRGGRLTVSYYTVVDPVEFANKGDVTVRGGSQIPTTALNATIDLNNPHPAAGLSTLEIDPGAGTTHVNVESTPKPVGDLLSLFQSVATTVTNDGVWYNLQTVTLNTPSQGVQAINGTVDVEDPNYYSGARTNLVIDDTGDNTARSNVNLSDSQVTGLAPAKITWGAISSLTVTGGGGGNSFNVSSAGGLPMTTLNAGDGGDTFTITVNPMSRYQLTVNGGKGYDALLVDVTSPAAQVSQPHGLVSVSSPVSKNYGSTIHYNTAIDLLDVNQPTALGGLGNGLDGNGNLLPPSLGGPSLLPPNLGGPNEGPPLM
jgi:hypothetical protein